MYYYLYEKIKYCKSEVYIDIGIRMGNLPNSNGVKASKVGCKNFLLHGSGTSFIRVLITPEQFIGSNIYGIYL